jgi:hypothetical protein
MALAEHISCESNKATLFVDTPEGSLDIAYEKRVGLMFADFVKNYQQNIIMTANINSSQLLVALAEKCKAGLMYVKRMLDWVDLSIVQQEEEMLFRKFLDNIESKLRRKK